VADLVAPNPLVINWAPGVGNGPRRLERIARYTRSGAYTWHHALRLVLELIVEDDAWTPIVVLSAEILRQVNR
jgi:hypothetical protein